MIGCSISEYPALFTDSPPVPASDRRQLLAYVTSKMASRFAAGINKEISERIKQTVPEIDEEGDKSRFGSFKGKALSV